MSACGNEWTLESFRSRLVFGILARENERAVLEVSHWKSKQGMRTEGLETARGPARIYRIINHILEPVK